MASKLCKRDGNGSDVGGLSLPEDIVFDVLARLPARYLCRFRCVSKRWRDLISDPAFVAAQRSRAGPLIVAMFGSTTADRHQLRLLDKHGDVLRVFDVTGTATLAPTRLGLVFVDRRHLGAMIIDPASGRASTAVGTNYPLPPVWARRWMSTASDYSFGRAPSGDYKALRLHRSRCEVATITDDGGVAELTWRQRPWGPIRVGSTFPRERKATVNGVLYFMPSIVTLSVSNDKNHIVAFNLESDEWEAETIKGPTLGRKEEEADKWSIALAELKGILCVVHNVGDLTGAHYADIWLLKDPNRSIWVKEYMIKMPESLLLFSMPLAVVGDGTILLLLNTFWSAERCHRYMLQFYNSSTKAFTDFMEMAEGFNGTMAFYTGSLLC